MRPILRFATIDVIRASLSMEVELDYAMEELELLRISK